MLSKNILIIGHGLPEPQSTGAGIRMMQLLELFSELDYKLRFCSLAKPNKDSALAKKNIPYTQVYLNADSFNDFIASLNPSVVLYDRFMTEEQFGWRVREVCPEAFTILDTEDLHFLRKSREAGIGEEMLLSELSDAAKRELASIYRCDLSLIISAYEIQFLNTLVPSAQEVLYHLPFLYKSEKSFSNLPKYEDREGFYFIGNGKHQPNIAAIEALYNLWPNIKKFVPDATLTIYGAYLPAKITQLHNPFLGFYVHGFVKELEAVLSKHRILLAPIGFGAGQKRKIFDAWITGSPVVTTHIGAEGISTASDFGGYIVQDNSDLIKKAVSLYNNQSEWNSLVKKGQEKLQSSYNWKHYRQRFRTVLEQKLADLNHGRQRNIVGQILWHHSLQSAKYMSKWIQEKNKAKEPPAS